MTLLLGHVPEGATTVEEVVRHRLVEGVGGLRGSVEAALPTVAFVVVWQTSEQLKPALLAAAGIVLVTLAVRLVQRQTPRYALGSLAAVGIAAVFALRSGRAQDAFLPGILYNSALLALSLVSVLARWPMVGFIVGAAHPEAPFAWREHPGIVRLCSRLTLVLAAMYAIRVAVMLPTYLVGGVALLGLEKIVLGWPLYLLAIAAIGAVLVRGHTPLDPEDREPVAVVEPADPDDLP